MNCKIFLIVMLTLSSSIAGLRSFGKFFRNNSVNSNFSNRDDMPSNEEIDDKLTFEEVIYGR